MKKVFVAGRRFDKMKNVCVLANSVVVFSFYFIYRYLFEPSYPDFVGAPLVAIFLLIEAVVIVLTNKVGAKIKAKIRYEIKPEYLEMSTGKTVQRFPGRILRKRSLTHTGCAMSSQYPSSWAVRSL